MLSKKADIISVGHPKQYMLELSVGLVGLCILDILKKTGVLEIYD